jgi:hypothetical protein
MLDTVTFRSPWVDPGATAFDQVDGNLTSSIQSFGAGAVDTSVPTLAGSPGFVVEYAVEDRSGNAAPVARRLVKVVCPGQDQVCIDPDTSQPTCTVGGGCGRQLQVLSASAGTARTIAGSSTNSARTAAAEAAAAPASAAAPVLAFRPPRITLLGPSVVEVVAGTSYDRCSASVPPGVVCDPGADVEGGADGNLVRQLMICGNRCGVLVAGNTRGFAVAAAAAAVPVAKVEISFQHVNLDVYVQMGRPLHRRPCNASTAGHALLLDAFYWCSHCVPLAHSFLLLCPRWRPRVASDRLVPLLLACGVPPDVPGQYPLVFSVTDSAGLSTRVVRQLVIRPACTAGERVCEDKVRKDGMCPVVDDTTIVMLQCLSYSTIATETAVFV